MRTAPRYNASETAVATEHAQCGAVTSHLLLLLLQLVSYCRRQVITCTSLRSQADSLQAVAAACDSHRTADSLGTGSAALYSRTFRGFCDNPSVFVRVDIYYAVHSPHLASTQRDSLAIKVGSQPAAYLRFQKEKSFHSSL